MALAAAKRLVDEGIELPFDTAVGLEREVVAMLFATADRDEGVRGVPREAPADLHRSLTDRRGANCELRVRQICR